jgi:hypothetical protein
MVGGRGVVFGVVESGKESKGFAAVHLTIASNRHSTKMHTTRRASSSHKEGGAADAWLACPKPCPKNN